MLGPNFHIILNSNNISKSIYVIIHFKQTYKHPDHSNQQGSPYRLGKPHNYISQFPDWSGLWDQPYHHPIQRWQCHLSRQQPIRTMQLRSFLKTNYYQKGMCRFEHYIFVLRRHYLGIRRQPVQTVRYHCLEKQWTLIYQTNSCRWVQHCNLGHQ